MLILDNVSKTYTNGKGIKNLSIQFQEGEITGILGRNGSGKTTMLKSILDLIQIDNGSILWNEKPVYDQYQDVAFISEEGSFMPNMSAKEYGIFLKDYYIHFDQNKYDELLSKFEISDGGKIKEFSKGQQMKTEIAAGFAMNAKLIVLDEPFNALDEKSVEKVKKIIKQRAEAGALIIVSCHDREILDQIADSIYYMEEGKIIRNEEK